MNSTKKPQPIGQISESDDILSNLFSSLKDMNQSKTNDVERLNLLNSDKNFFEKMEKKSKTVVDQKPFNLKPINVEYKSIDLDTINRINQGMCSSIIKNYFFEINFFRK